MSRVTMASMSVAALTCKAAAGLACHWANSREDKAGWCPALLNRMQQTYKIQ
jgi:hypothetical protein